MKQYSLKASMLFGMLMVAMLAAVNACASVTVSTGTYTLTINDAGVAPLIAGGDQGDR